MKLEWGDYRHFPYERELAVREAVALLGDAIAVCPSGQVTSGFADLQQARKLTYFSKARSGDDVAITVQSELERSGSTRRGRQATRYSVHGLHEYRGKFNPQVCAALINILGVDSSQSLLDPFCGSGTTLVEAAHRGIHAIGADLNPLAVFIANAKLRALSQNPKELRKAAIRVTANCNKVGSNPVDDARQRYLNAWFEPRQLEEIESLRSAILSEEESLQPFLFVVASNLLRDFSLQNPADLRIRRRPTANAIEPFVEAFSRAINEAINRLEAAVAVLPVRTSACQAILCDNRNLQATLKRKFDAAITSPPYATALPYIDTQRLSLIWLNLLQPSEIAKVEGDLIGSREMNTATRRLIVQSLQANNANLPEDEADLCIRLSDAVGPGDGFRRQAVPTLLYRYFDLMQQTFNSVASSMKPNGRFALIVGHNHTQLGGTRYDIDTPAHLASLASNMGWTVEEITPLQPYHRYSLHSANAVKSETLLVLRTDELPHRNESRR